MRLVIVPDFGRYGNAETHTLRVQEGTRYKGFFSLEWHSACTMPAKPQAFHGRAPSFPGIEAVTIVILASVGNL